MIENTEIANTDIVALYREYSEKYFESVLHKSSTYVEWSNRMKTCAGITYLYKNNCIIRLSMPLLKYRALLELKETLLHEMIHAYLFLMKKETYQDYQNGGHGPVM